MKKISEYLDRAKDVTGSDYKTAQVLGVTRAAVSKWRRTEIIGNKHAPKLAELIGVNPGEIVAASDSELHPENRVYWEQWVAGFAIMAVGIMALSPEISGVYEQASFGGLYIMRSVDSVTWFLLVVAVLSIIVGSRQEKRRILRQ